MTTFQQRFEIVALPKDADECARLSVAVTQQLGAKGWEVMAVVPSGATVVLVLQKPL